MRSFTLNFIGIFTIISSLFAEQVSQTDWSGGDGILGPVNEWGNQFYISENVVYKDFYQGILRLKADSFEVGEIINVGYFFAPTWIRAEDINNDGYTDFVVLQANKSGATKIYWFENLNGTGVFTSHFVTNTNSTYSEITLGDWEEDGDIDIAYFIGERYLVVYKNDGNGNFVESDTVIDLNPADLPYIADFNNDGYSDAVCHVWENGNIVICINQGDYQNFSYDTLTYGDNTSSYSYYGIGYLPYDLDQDGDIDIIASVRHNSKDSLVWFENDGNANFTYHFIDTIRVFQEFSCSDIDQDGDIDIVAVRVSNVPDGRILLWYENDGSQNFTRHEIADSIWAYEHYLSYSSVARAGDFDGDGDIDIITSWYIPEGKSGWFENDGNQNFTFHPFISQKPGYVFDVADIDNDATIDVIYGAQAIDSIFIFKTRGYYASGEGYLISSILNVSSGVMWDSLKWDADEPSGTYIEFYLRSGQTIEACTTDVWHGPIPRYGADPSDYINDGDSLIQYKVVLNTTIDTLSPVFNEVHIYFSRDLNPPILESLTVYNDTAFLGPFPVNVKATDDIGIKIVHLYYKVDDSDWVVITMDTVSGLPNWYRGEIPEMPATQDTYQISYFAEAFDSASNATCSDTISFLAINPSSKVAERNLPVFDFKLPTIHKGRIIIHTLSDKTRDMHIKIFSINGRTVLNRKLKLRKGANDIIFRLKPGIYFVEIKLKNRRLFKKVTVIK